VELEDDEEEGAEGVEDFDEEVPPETDVGGEVGEEEASVRGARGVGT
jgi:hypothetical protein